MAASRVNSAAARAAARPTAARTEAARTEAGPADIGRTATSPVELVEFAVGEVLREDSAVDALPAILGRLTAIFGCRSALALQHDADRDLVVVAAHPRQEGENQALCAEICALSAAHGQAGNGGYFQATLTAGRRPDGEPLSVLMAYSPPDGGRCLCAIAVIGNAARLTAECRGTTHAIAAIVAAEIRHANDTAELAERQARTQALVERSPDAIVVAGADRRLVVFNLAAEELTGWQRDEVLGKDLTEVFVPERDRHEVLQFMRTYLESGDAGSFVGRMRLPTLCADGTERMIELTPVQLTIDGQVHFCGFMRDVSELDRAHDALQESDARFRQLSQLAPVGIVQTDLNGMCTFANVRWCELTGMTMAQALGAGWSTGVHPDDVGRLAQEWAQSAATGRELSTDCRLQSADGRQAWAHISVVTILAADERPCGYLSAVTDVSDRKRAEAEKEKLHTAERAARRDLADQTQRLNSVLAAAIPGILVADENGLITQVNKSFCDLFGINERSEQLIGIPAAQLVLRIKGAFADPGEFLRRTGAAFAARQPVRGERMKCTDGRTFGCDYWPVLVDGGYRGDLWMAWDMSEGQALEDQRERLLEAELAAREAAEQAQFRLAEQNARLQELDQAKTQFFATMSHELRTPLTSIVSFTDLILDDDAHELAPDTVSSLSIIHRNADRLLRLMGDLLLLSRLETGGIPLDLAAVSVPDLVGETARSASATAAERGITVQASAAAGPPVQGDKLRLQQVLDNLLSNAIKFSGQDGRVRVAASHDGQMWRIDVTDEGIGIPADEIGLLFGRFVRASNARMAGLPGTGLGLSVVKAITELHGGCVAVRSVVGQGTTLSIYLPISQ